MSTRTVSVFMFNNNFTLIEIQVITAYKISVLLVQISAFLCFSCGEKPEYPEKIHLSDHKPLHMLTPTPDLNLLCTGERPECWTLSQPDSKSENRCKSFVQSGCDNALDKIHLKFFIE